MSLGSGPKKVPGKVRGPRNYYHWARCEGCGCDLMPQNEWNAADKDTRAFWRDQGIMRQSVGPYCYKAACQRARRDKEASDGKA